MVVVWRITERCNLGCEFCRYDHALKWKRRDANPLQVVSFGKLLAEYQQSTGDSVFISWLGGEPLFWQPLLNLSRIFKYDYQLRLGITTNGTPLSSADTRAHLLESYSELTISIDGFAGFHNRVRHFHNGFELLRRAIGKLVEEKRSLESGTVLRVNVVLMRDNIDQFEALCGELAGWGIQEITFNQLGGLDRPEFYPQHRLLPQQTKWLSEEFPRIRLELAAKGLKLRGGAAYLQRIRSSSINELIPVHNCKPGESFLFIDERGRIAPCGFTPDSYGVPLDEVDSVGAILALPARFTAMRENRRQVACDDCQSTQVFEKWIQ